MKSKNRRAFATRSNPGSEDNRVSNPDLPTSDEVTSAGTTSGTATKRKKTIESANTSTRSSKLANTPSTGDNNNSTINLPNGHETKAVTKKKRNATSSSNAGTNEKSPHNPNHRRHSQSTSSTSSIVSGSADPIDPYEFAVKTEDEITDCGINTNVAPIKRMKLDRVDDNCLPSSACSSPLPQSTFSHPSPGANSSPLTVHHHRQRRSHYTCPLSVLTDFNPITTTTTSCVMSCSSPSSAGSSPGLVPQNTGGLDVSAPNTTTSQTHSRLAASTTPSVSSTPRLHVHSTSPEPDSNGINHRIQTPVTTPTIEANIIPTSQSPSVNPAESGEPRTRPTLLPVHCCTNTVETIIETSVGFKKTLDLDTVSNVRVSAPVPLVKSEPRCVGVNTVLEDLCKATITEPDLLGPCEPGTTICLNGIVWLETTTGVLVVNVTWRGRTYIGTLLDATQHDFAPPCPRDYISPFKSSVRSSNRTKRRAGTINSNFKHTSNVNATFTNSSNSMTQHTTDGRCNTNGSQRQRLRGRNANSPATGSKMLVASGSDSVSVARGSTARPTPTSTPHINSNTPATICSTTKTDAEDLDEQTRHALNPCLDDDRTTPITTLMSTTRNKDGDEVDGQPKNHLICLSEEDKSGNSEVMTDNCSPPKLVNSAGDTVYQATGTSTIDTTTKINRVAPEHSEVDEDEVDDEINSTYPIRCPLAGCRKRFTHVIALRFHLNHTPHNGPKRHVEKNVRQHSNASESSANASAVVTVSTTPSVLSPTPVVSTPAQPVCPISPPINSIGSATANNAPPRAVVPPIPIQSVPLGLHRPSAVSDASTPGEARHLGMLGPGRKPDAAYTFLFGCGDTCRGGGGGSGSGNGGSGVGTGTLFTRPSGAVGTVTHEQSPSGLSTRTVTAHTVSIPHGPLVDKVDLTQTGRTSAINNSVMHHSHHHATQTKRTNSTSRGSDFMKLPRTNPTTTSTTITTTVSRAAPSCHKVGELPQQLQQQSQQVSNLSRRSVQKEVLDITSHLSSVGDSSLRPPGTNTNGSSFSAGPNSRMGSSWNLFPTSTSILPSGSPAGSSRLNPSSSPLFTLPQEMWLGPPPLNAVDPRASFLSEAESIPSTTRYSCGSGMWMNGSALPTSLNQSSPTTIAGNFTSGHHSHANSRSTNGNGQSISTPPVVPTTIPITTVPALVSTSAPNLLDSSMTAPYGLPDFLMAAAAMSSALGPTHPMMEALRSYISQADPSKPPLTASQLPPPPNGPQVHYANKALPSIGLPSVSLSQPPTYVSPLLSTGLSSTPTLAPSASLASMMMAAAAVAGSGTPDPALLTPSMMHTALGLTPNQTAPGVVSGAQTPSNLLPNPGVNFDPFTFSTAYLMQQSNSGSQLSSSFTQPSS